MKKVLGSILITLSVLFIVASCEVEPPVPACESGHWGWVTVINSTGYSAWVDVTWGNVVENYEKHLYNGNSYKYNEIPAGSIEIWISFDGDDWVYDYENLSSCEDMDFTWYLSARKSANGCPFVLVLPDGRHVAPTKKVK